MLKDDQKHLARKRRERRLRMWLTTLSWTTPVVAFGGFFTLWHDIGTTASLRKPSRPQLKIHAATQSVSFPVQFQVGSQGRTVRLIQEQLAALGYFHHDLTEYYGPVTQAAVSKFQATHNLPVTGKIDTETLNAMQQSMRQQHVTTLTQVRDDHGSATNHGTALASNPSQGTTPSTSAVGVSQSTNSVAVTSAS